MTEKLYDKARVLVCGAGGFIGGHLVKRLKSEGYWVRGIDLKGHEFCPSQADEFIIGDLRDLGTVRAVLADGIEDVYQLAADMGGAGFVFTGDNDAAIMHNSAMINLNIAQVTREAGIKRLFYSSSACVYASHNLKDPNNPKCWEESAYPADPDSNYGWEKLFSERMYLACQKNYGLEVRIARFHNTYGPEGTWRGGREKAPAAICRKVAEAPDGGEIELWGDGRTTRSYIYIDANIEGIRRLMESDFPGPVNIGTEEMVTVEQLARMAIGISGKSLGIRYVPGPQGPRGRNSDNRLIRRMLGWEPVAPLCEGMEKTYRWVAEQVAGKTS